MISSSIQYIATLSHWIYQLLYSKKALKKFAPWMTSLRASLFERQHKKKPCLSAVKWGSLWKEQTSILGQCLLCCHSAYFSSSGIKGIFSLSLSLFLSGFLVHCPYQTLERDEGYDDERPHDLLNLPWNSVAPSSNSCVAVWKENFFLHFFMFTTIRHIFPRKKRSRCKNSVHFEFPSEEMWVTFSSPLLFINASLMLCTWDLFSSTSTLNLIVLIEDF